jgi:hypothetical protein
MRQITVKVSSQSYFEPDMLRKAVIMSLSAWPNSDMVGPASVYAGTALFLPALKSESECTVILHEGSPEGALAVWHRLRDTVKNVDCGRIEDRGKSWCAKAYENSRMVLDGDRWVHRYRWPDHHFAPVNLR